MDNLNEEIDLVLEESLKEEEGTEKQIALNRLRLSKAKSVEDFYKIYKRLLQLTGKEDQISMALRTSASEGPEVGARFISGFDADDRTERAIRMNFLRVYSRVISRLRAAAAEAAGPETEDPEPEPEAGGEAEEEAGPEGEAEEEAGLTDEEEERLERNANEAIELLAKRTILLGNNSYNNVRVLRTVGNVIRKYFISKKTFRINEEEAGPSAASPEPTPPRSGGGRSDEEIARLFDQLSSDVLITPDESDRNLEELKTRIRNEKVEEKFNGLSYSLKLKLDQVKYFITQYAQGKLNEERTLNEDKMLVKVLDLEELKKNKLNESFLAMFGGWIQMMLDDIFRGNYSAPVTIRGTQSDVNSFAKAFNGERRYLEAAKRYGLDHPTTYKNKAKLDNAVKSFERDTGLIWPFK